MRSCGTLSPWTNQSHPTLARVPKHVSRRCAEHAVLHGTFGQALAPLPGDASARRRAHESSDACQHSFRCPHMGRRHAHGGSLGAVAGCEGLARAKGREPVPGESQPKGFHRRSRSARSRVAGARNAGVGRVKGDVHGESRTGDCSSVRTATLQKDQDQQSGRGGVAPGALMHGEMPPRNARTRARHLAATTAESDETQCSGLNSRK